MTNHVNSLSATTLPLGLHLTEASCWSLLQYFEISILISFGGAPLRYRANLIQWRHPAHLRTIDDLFWTWSNCLVLLWLCILPDWEQSGSELSGHWQISLISYLLWPPVFCILIRKKIACWLSFKLHEDIFVFQNSKAFKCDIRSKFIKEGQEMFQQTFPKRLKCNTCIVE